MSVTTLPPAKTLDLSPLEQDRLDAARFRALCNAPRLRWIGLAGFNAATREAYHIEPDYRHLTVDIWSTYQYDKEEQAVAEAEMCKKTANYLTEMADVLIANQQQSDDG